MSSIKICVLAMLIAGVAMSQSTGSTASCPSAPDASIRFYFNGTECPQVTTCETTFCTCAGGTRNGGPECTFPNTTRPSCSAAETCAAAYIACVDNVATTNASCAATSNLRVSLLSIQTGTLYNATAAWTHCRYRACLAINGTAGNNCTAINFATTCQSPIKFLGTVLLRGAFTAVLADATKRESLAKALDTDLSNKLGIAGVYVTRMYVYGTARPTTERPKPSRRQATTDNLVVEYTAPGVSSNNAALKTKLTELTTQDSAWLVSTKTAYASLANSTVSLSFLGGAEGSGSSAFSANKFNSLIKSTPPTPAPPPTTPPTPTPPSPPSTTKGGAAMQSLLAAVVVAVLSALMF